MFYCQPGHTATRARPHPHPIYLFIISMYRFSISREEHNNWLYFYSNEIQVFIE
jgi:hypothetical protein